MRFRGLGRIDAPLGVVRLEGLDRLVVSPWAAIGTDVLLIGSGAALTFVAKPPLLKALGIAAGAWGLIAMTVEIVKLASPPVDVTIRREY